MDFEQQLQGRLNKWKTDLLDLSRANRLLNFKTTLKSTVQLDTDADKLFQDLNKNRVIQVRSHVDWNKFASKVKPKRLRIDPESPTDVETNDSASMYPKLETALKNIRSRNQEYVNEKGTHILYLTFGMFKWTEVAYSKELLNSPLLLLPVTLSRKSATKPYTLSRTDDDIIFNPALEYKLTVDFGLEIPNLLDDRDEDSSITDLLEQYRGLLEVKKDWQLEAETHIGLFSFRNLVMFKDFEQYKALFERHPIIRSLVGEENELLDSGEYESVEDVDVHHSSQELFQVLDADSSQQDAILAARSGLSFIIQGPPGTGKSQTIANIIAETVAQGKRVLFVSEKLAALQVVKRKLEERHLGDFCLELHSNKANKKSVLAELQNSLNADANGVNVDNTLYHHLDTVKQDLNKYVHSLHKPVTALSQKPFTIHGRLAKLDSIPDMTFSIHNADQYTNESLNKIVRSLKELEQEQQTFKQSHIHPWRYAINQPFGLSFQSNITVRFERLAQNLQNLSALLSNSKRTIEETGTLSLQEVHKILQLAAMLKASHEVPDNWLTAIDFPQKVLFNECLKSKTLFEELHSIQNATLSRFEEPFLQEDVENIYEVLTLKHASIIETYSAHNGNLFDLYYTNRDNFDDWFNQLKKSLDALNILIANARRDFEISIDKATFQDLRELSCIFSTLATDPQSAESWFDGKQRSSLNNLFEESLELFAEYNESLSKLEGECDLNILTEDIHSLVERYVVEYASSFRFLKSSYRRDRRKLRLYWNHRKYSYTDVVRILRMAAKVKQIEARIADREEAFRTNFGQYYQGNSTNWNELQSNMASIFHMCDTVLPDKITSQLKQKLMNRGVASQKALFANLASQAEEHLSSCQDNLGNLATTVSHDDFQFNWSKSLQAVYSAANSLEHALVDRSTAVDITNHYYRKEFNGVENLLSDIQVVRDLIDLKLEVEQDTPIIRETFGRLFTGIETSWDTVAQAIKWTVEVRDTLQEKVSSPVVSMISGDNKELLNTFEKEAEMLNNALDECSNDIRFFYTVIEEDAPAINGETFRAADLQTASSALKRWSATSSELESWLRLLSILENEQLKPFQGLLTEITNRDLHDYPYHQLFLKQFYKSWLDKVYQSDPVLANFHPNRYNEYVQEFRNLDKTQLERNCSRIRYRLFRVRDEIRIDWYRRGEQKVLQRELSKKKRHKPIRRLFVEVPNLIFALKPCLMMSPLSVSQYIDPLRIHFDLVIFDEASQMTPETAIGAIVRGDQLIVAGDSKQLPPTNFFTSFVDQDDEFVDEDDDTNNKFESILEECQQCNMTERSLKWHYRSKHESLIAFSNQEIYNNSLYTFPSPSSGEEQGISLVHVDNGVYDRGKSRKNEREAERVAHLVVQHFQVHPERSLGVIALSKPQQESIEDKIEHLIQTEFPELEPCLASDGLDPFFVKNLETVQGDERDTIILSIGYAKDQNGNLYYHFGPLSQSGGERRLNVAITRAKHQIHVVTSLLPSDLDDQKLHQRGSELLKAYLHFAQTGDFSVTTATGGGFDSPFEEDVYNKLTAQGLWLEPQVGSSSYRIDLAIKDPQHPGRYLLGIECDGATYHSSRTARDRDRLRQQVLEQLGWKIYRIWSQDWMKRKKEIISDILSHVDHISDPIHS